MLQNIRLDGEKIVHEANSPFNTIIEAHSGKLWRQTCAALRTFRWGSLREKLILVNAPKPLTHAITLPPTAL